MRTREVGLFTCKTCGAKAQSYETLFLLWDIVFTMGFLVDVTGASAKYEAKFQDYHSRLRGQMAASLETMIREFNLVMGDDTTKIKFLSVGMEVARVAMERSGIPDGALPAERIRLTSALIKAWPRTHGRLRQEEVSACARALATVAVDMTALGKQQAVEWVMSRAKTFGPSTPPRVAADKLLKQFGDIDEHDNQRIVNLLTWNGHEFMPSALPGWRKQRQSE